MSKITAVVIGAGARGRVYAEYAQNHPDELEIVAVAEPDGERRERFARENGLDAGCCYESWEPLLARGRIADAALVCTMDRQHFAPTMAAIELGYQILLEKPMSTNRAECVAMQKAAEEKGVLLSVCHVLRFTPFYQKIKELITSGAIGELQVLQQTEHVGYWHQAHSFVRGNWRDSDETAPMILAKCCHDMDILLWLAGSDCTRVASFGSLGHFTPAHAPAGAPPRCLDGCPAAEECPYYAPKIYLTDNIDWPTDTISVDLSDEARRRALETGPYGRCVYHCDNNVVDHQTVNLEFESGAVANLIMTAFTAGMTRRLTVHGTRGELCADMERFTITLQRFGEAEPHPVPLSAGANSAYGHGGGDVGLMADFVRLVAGKGQSEGLTSARTSMQSHLMCFAAEQSRISGGSVQQLDRE